MSSSTPSRSKDLSPQDRQKINDFLGEIQEKLETLMREKSSPQENARIFRLELENSDLRQKKVSSEAYINTLEKKICEEAEERDVTNSNLKKELKEAQARIKELEEKRAPNFGNILREHDNEVSHLRAKISGLAVELEEAHEQIESILYKTPMANEKMAKTDAETTQIIMDMEKELHEAKKAMKQMTTVPKEVETSNKALERSLRKEINKIGASLGQCRAQKADVERKLKEAQEKIEVLESRDVTGHTRSPDLRSQEVLTVIRKVKRPDPSPCRTSCLRNRPGITRAEEANRRGAASRPTTTASRDVRGHQTAEEILADRLFYDEFLGYPRRDDVIVIENLDVVRSRNERDRRICAEITGVSNPRVHFERLHATEEQGPRRLAYGHPRGSCSDHVHALPGAWTRDVRGPERHQMDYYPCRSSNRPPTTEDARDVRRSSPHHSPVLRYFDPYASPPRSRRYMSRSPSRSFSPVRRAPVASGRRPYEVEPEPIGSNGGSGFSTNGFVHRPEWVKKPNPQDFTRAKQSNPKESWERPEWALSDFTRAQQSDPTIRVASLAGPSETFSGPGRKDTMAGPSEDPRGSVPAPLKSVGVETSDTDSSDPLIGVAIGAPAETSSYSDLSDEDDDDW